MNNLRIDTSDGYAHVIFSDRQLPPVTGTLEETVWSYSGTGKDERVLDIAIGEHVLKLPQSDIRELLPYLQRFVETGKLVEEKSN